MRSQSKEGKTLGGLYNQLKSKLKSLTHMVEKCISRDMQDDELAEVQRRLRKLSLQCTNKPPQLARSCYNTNHTFPRLWQGTGTLPGAAGAPGCPTATLGGEKQLEKPQKDKPNPHSIEGKISETPPSRNSLRDPRGVF